MFALTFQGKVVQLEASSFPVSNALEWIDIDGVNPQPQVDWSYDGSVFTAPPVPPPPLTDPERAEIEIRGSKALLALGRIATADDTLTEDALVALVRAKLP